MIGRAQAAWEDPSIRGRLLRWAWLVSTAFTLFGFAMIAYLLFVR